MKHLKKKKKSHLHKHTQRAFWLMVSGFTLFLVILFISNRLLLSGRSASANAVSWAPQQTPPLMAGDILWNGVPSMMWGTNDTQIWDANNSLITEPAIQQETKADHLSLLRTWLFQTDLATNQPETDVYQESKVAAGLATGAKLLCELPTGNSMAYDEQMVALFKGKCSYYEFMNEPDDENVAISTYVSDWTTEIPKLRAIDPQAKFGGIAAAAPQYSQCTYSNSDTTCYMQKVLQGMAQNNVLPDFVTFHYYPCWNDTAASCLSKAATFGDQVRMVRSWVNQYFGAAGQAIPIGVTEWNADPSAPMPSYTNDACWLEQFTTIAEESMAQAGASFANQFDLADYGGYGSDDMVDIYHNGAAKPQYYALLQVMDQIDPYGVLPMPTLAFTQPADCSVTSVSVTPSVTITPTITPTPTTTTTSPTPTIKPTSTPTPTQTPIVGQGTLTFLGSTQTGGVFSGTGLKVKLPSNIQQNDLLIAVAGTNGVATTWNTPSGWQKGANSKSKDSQSIIWWWKIADGSESGKTIVLKSKAYEDGGALVMVYKGESANPIAGVSAFTTSDNSGNGHVTLANVGKVNLSSSLDVVPLIFSSWQPNATSIAWPTNFIFEANASDGYASVALSEMAQDEVVTTAPAYTLQFSSDQAVIQTLQVLVRVK